MDQTLERPGCKEAVKGVGGPLIGAIMAVVIGGVFLLIGIFISAKVDASIPEIRTWNGSEYLANNASIAYNDAKNNIFSAFSILGIALIVAGAVAILVILVSSFRGGGM